MSHRLDNWTCCRKNLILLFCKLQCFGHKKFLKIGDDDNALLTLLEADNSDIDIFSDDENESDTEITEVAGCVPPEESESDDDSDAEPLINIKRRLDIENQEVNRKRWKKMDSFIPLHFNSEEVEDGLEDRSNWQVENYVDMYFSDTDFQNMADCTTLRILQDTEKAMNLTVTEIKQFIGISILMSCLRYPNVRMYWAKTTKVNAIASVMSRDRFFKIRNNLKVIVDADVPAEVKQNDRFYKIRPVIERIRNGCLSLPRFKEVAVDEQMIPFTGSCKMKQFVRGKPNPEGLKNFVCATPKGLILDFELYQGQNTFLHSNKTLGVGPSAVIRLEETLKEGTHIYIDRYFTTIPLLDFMLERKIFTTGTS